MMLKSGEENDDSGCTSIAADDDNSAAPGCSRRGGRSAGERNLCGGWSMRKASWFVAVLLIADSGCRSQQLARDEDHIRCAVLELQTNQIMDNLIRIRRGLPII